MTKFTMSVIPRANALALQGYRHCCHVMLHCPVEAKLFGFYPARHAVLCLSGYTRGQAINNAINNTVRRLGETREKRDCDLSLQSLVLEGMQLRFDGRFGFPGGFVDDGEDLETAINREVVEELGKTSEPVNISKEDYVISHLYEEHLAELNKTKKLCLHFFTKKIPLEQFLELEKRRPDAPNLGYEVLGVLRCPLYIMADKQGGLPSFLRNNFVGNSRQQLLIGLEHASILKQEEIKEAVHLSQLIQVSTPRL